MKKQDAFEKWWLDRHQAEQDKQEAMEEIRSKFLNEVEWEFEKEGAIIGFEEAVELVERDMRSESWTEEAFDLLHDHAEEFYEEAAASLRDIVRNANAADPYAGKSFYDRFL